MAAAASGKPRAGESKDAPEDAGKHAFEFVDWGPPPDMRQRQLIFDSMQKIVNTVPQRSGSKDKDKPKDNRGTYVFTWGAGYAGQLGRKFVRGQKKYSAVPLLIDMDEVVRKSGLAIRQVACGGLHTAVVTETGQVYTWGDGRNGELGHIHDPSLKQTPRLVEDLDNAFVTQVACGRGHTVAVTESGKVYSWGLARSGQLGHGDHSNRSTPKVLDHPLARDIVAAACGDKHTVLLSRSGEVFTFGCGKHGQTGHGDGNERFSPCRVDALAGVTITSVACGAIHTCFVSAEGDVWLCGFGEYFHPNETQHFWYAPKKLTLPEPVVQVACGQSHNVALTAKGNVYAWGAGDYGQIGYGTKASTSIPRLVLDCGDIAQVAAGRYHSFALSTSGVLWSWGCGENGQLGQNSDENVDLPKIVTPILGTVVGQVACGEHHTAVLTSAPWTRLASDVSNMYQSAKYELGLKEDRVKATGHGLTRSDLATIKEDLRNKERQNGEERRRNLQKEHEELEREIAAVQYTGALQESVAQRIREIGPAPDVNSYSLALRTALATGAPASSSTASGSSTSLVPALLPGGDGLHHGGDAASSSSAGAGSAAASAGSIVAAFAAETKAWGDHYNLDPGSVHHPTLRLPHIPGVTAPGVTFPGGPPLSALPYSSSSSSAAGGLSAGSGSGSGSGKWGVGGHMSGLAQTARSAPTEHSHVPGLLPSLSPGGSSGAGAGAGAGAHGRMPHTHRGVFSATSPAGAGEQVPTSRASSTRQARAMFLRETANMVKAMTATVQDKGESAQARHVQKLTREVFEARRSYDELCHEARVKTRLLQDLRRDMELLQQQASGVRALEEVGSARVKGLEMQLNTVTIKIAETAENRQNYQTNIVHLKEEDFDSAFQLKALRQQSEDDADLRRMNSLKQAALADRDQAAQELEEFRGEVKAYQAFVADQFAQFESILNVIRSHNQKREQVRESQAEKARAKLSTKIQRLHEEVKHTEEESSAQSARLTSLDLKLRHFEDSFAKITAATGLNNPDGIVNKYFFKGEIKEQLQQEIQEKQRRIEALRKHEAELRARLTSASATHREQTWRDVDRASETVRELDHRTAKAQHDRDTVARRLAFIQEGVLSLSKTVSAATLSRPRDVDAAGVGVGLGAGVGAGAGGAAVAGGGHELVEYLSEETSNLWTAHMAERVLERIHLDMDLLLEAEKEYHARLQAEASKHGRNGSKWGFGIAASGAASTTSSAGSSSAVPSRTGSAGSVSSTGTGPASTSGSASTARVGSASASSQVKPATPLQSQPVPAAVPTAGPSRPASGAAVVPAPPVPAPAAPVPAPHPDPAGPAPADPVEPAVASAGAAPDSVTAAAAATAPALASS